MKRTITVVGTFIAVLGYSTIEANAKFSDHQMRLGEVIAICHYLDDGRIQNSTWMFYPDTGQVWVDGVPAGRVLLANEYFLAAEIVIIGVPIPFHLANILIDRKTLKFLHSGIQRHCESTGCEYKAVAFEGECHQIISGHP